jgi:hypothetical protein
VKSNSLDTSRRLLPAFSRRRRIIAPVTFGSSTQPEPLHFGHFIVNYGIVSTCKQEKLTLFFWPLARAGERARDYFSHLSAAIHRTIHRAAAMAILMANPD